MRFKVLLEDFVVREEVELALVGTGPYSIYRVEKRGITTLQAQVRMASMLGLPPSAILFPALKDRRALAIQYASVRGQGPLYIKGKGFSARRVGYASRRLAPRDLKGNHFTVVLRDITPQEMRGFRERISQVTEFGLPNYFDRQRFGSYVPGEGFIGRKILERDAEGALRMYFTLPLPVDPPSLRSFKAKAARHWGEWALLLQEAPRPSNFRSVLTFLKDHPTGFRKALNLIPARLLSLFLAAYQGFLWNRVAGRYLKGQLGRHGVPFASLFVVGEALPLYFQLPPGLLAFLAEAKVPLPHHRATIVDPELAHIMEDVLREEGLSLGDFKARILRRAYLSRGDRALLLFPRDLSLAEGDDELFAGRRKLTLRFFLPPGSYATLVVKALASRPPPAGFDPGDVGPACQSREERVFSDALKENGAGRAHPPPGS